MLKRLIRTLCKKIYLAGKYAAREEVSRHITADKRSKLLAAATLPEHFDMLYYANATIHNAHGDRSKVRIGEQSQIKGELEVVLASSVIEIGDNTFVGQGTKIISVKKITIGNRVLIAHNVNIYDNNSHSLHSKLRHEDYLFICKNGYQAHDDFNAKEVVIEDDAWIGFNSIILKGVRIGKGAIVGAGTLVVKDVPPYAVVIGNPARIISYTD